MTVQEFFDAEHHREAAYFLGLGLGPFQPRAGRPFLHFSSELHSEAGCNAVEAVAAFTKAMGRAPDDFLQASSTDLVAIWWFGEQRQKEISIAGLQGGGYVISCYDASKLGDRRQEMQGIVEGLGLPWSSFVPSPDGSRETVYKLEAPVKESDIRALGWQPVADFWVRPGTPLALKVQPDCLKVAKISRYQAD